MQERRHAERYPCDGSVEIQQGDNQSSRLWGHLGDISSLGFYMSSFGTWAVHTEARFKIEIGDTVFEGSAVVTTAYPGVGMGFAFGEMSPDNRAKLQAVITKLKTTTGPSTGFVIER